MKLDTTEAVGVSRWEPQGARAAERVLGEVSNAVHFEQEARGLKGSPMAGGASHGPRCCVRGPVFSSQTEARTRLR